MKKLVRFIFNLLPKSLVLPIPRGKLKGKKWAVKSGLLGYYFGTYEPAMTRAFMESVKEGDVVYDIGSHVGYYTLLASVLVGKNGKVFAFEPSPRNCGYLMKHIKINKCSNVTPVFCAVVDKGGEAITFQEDGDSATGKINGGAHSILVGTTSLDEMGLVPDVIKIDVESAEAMVLKGGINTLKKHHPLILFEVHGPNELNECTKILRECGYKIDCIGEGLGGEKHWFVARQRTA